VTGICAILEYGMARKRIKETKFHLFTGKEEYKRKGKTPM
jgi:hypothetical protein